MPSTTDRTVGAAIEDQDIDALRRHVRAACEVLDA